MDATCKVQDNIHVFRLVHNMCPGFWVHITYVLGFFRAKFAQGVEWLTLSYNPSLYLNIKV